MTPPESINDVYFTTFSMDREKKEVNLPAEFNPSTSLRPHGDLPTLILYMTT